MIHKILPKIIAELNAFLKLATSNTDDLVVLSNLVDQSGGIAFSGENKIVCMLTAIGEEPGNPSKIPSGPLMENPPIYLNLNLLFAAYFPGNYEESLKFISLVFTYFQAKRVFRSENTPGLPPEVVKVSVEINHLDQHTQNQLWQAIGANMMPSISIKLRMITLDKRQDAIHPITNIVPPTITGKN